MKEFVPKISAEVLYKNQKLSKKLLGYKKMETLLQRYQEIDYLLTRVEEYTGQAFEEWDRAVQQQIDIMRGK